MYAGDRFTEEFLEGVRRRAETHALDLHIVQVKAQTLTAEVFTAHPVSHDSGYIAVSTGVGIHFAAGALLFSPAVKSALIDYITPNSSCVVADNFDGMGKLVGHAVAKGCRRLVFVPDRHYTGPLNANERELAFRLETLRLGLEGTVLKSGNLNDLTAALREAETPTAVFFPQDVPALRCKNVLRSAGLRHQPLVLGFDDFSPSEKGLEQLTTLRVDRAGMGAAAVDLLQAPNYDSNHPVIIRVPGELVVRG